MQQEKYHIRFGKKRTTITVDTILSDLLSIKLGTTPRSMDAKIMVREWLQATLPERLGTDSARKNASQYARKYLIEEIADEKLLSKLVDGNGNWLQ